MITVVISHSIMFVLGGFSFAAVLACVVLYAAREKLYP